MITVTHLTPENLASMEPLYAEFAQQAVNQYRWYSDPLDFSQFSIVVQHKGIYGLLAYEVGNPTPVAFMLYSLEAHGTLTINILYQQPSHTAKVMLGQIMNYFLEFLKTLPGWEVVSYPLMGLQEEYVRSILWYGFKPVGQAIVKFSIVDPVSFQVLQQQKQPALPSGYQLKHWDVTHQDEVANVLYHAFEQAADARWDLRFKSIEGTREIIRMVTSNEIGEHLASCTSLLLKNGVAIGFCFLIQNSITQGNIPLIGVIPEEKGQGFGIQLLKYTLDECLQEIMDEKVALYEINATLETDNYASVKMYRRLGFMEEYNYPHVYLTKQALEARVPGKWC